MSGPMRWFCVAAVAAAFASGCAPAPGGRDAVAPPDTVLATLSADEGGEFLLGIEACGERGCPIVIAWREAGKVVAKTELAWRFPVAEVTEGTAEAGSGVGDPLGEPGGATAWLAGEEESAVTVSVTRMTAPERRPALLVQQGAGFEHYKRRHELFVAGGEPGLESVWSYEDGSGPWWSAVVVDEAPGGDEWLLFRGWYGDMTEPDTLAVSRIRLEGGSAVVRGSASVTVLAIGPFNSLDAARAMQRACPSRAAIMPAGALSGTPPDGLYAVLASGDPLLAEAAARALAECSGLGPPVSVSLDVAGR